MLRRFAAPSVALILLLVSTQFDNFVSDAVGKLLELAATWPWVGPFVISTGGFMKSNFQWLAGAALMFWIGRLYERELHGSSSALIIAEILEARTDRGNHAWDIVVKNEGEFCNHNIVRLEAIWRESDARNVDHALPIPLLTHSQRKGGRSGRFNLGPGESKKLRLCEIGNSPYGIVIPLERHDIHLLELGESFVLKLGLYGTSSSSEAVRISLTKTALSAELLSAEARKAVAKRFSELGSEL